jgi:signal transduction histidine kinase
MHDSPEPKTESRPRILVVDDEPRSLELLVRTLRRLGHVETASSGDAAVDKLRQREPFHLVITDQRMPGMKGSALLEQVAQRDGRTARILLTGYADMQATIDAINRGGVHAYVSKPWKPDHLLALARTLIERTLLSQRNEELVKDLSARNEQLEIAMAEILRANHQLSAGAIGPALQTLVRHFQGALAKAAEAAARLAPGDSATPSDARQDAARQVRAILERLGDTCCDLLELAGEPDPAPGRREAAIDDVARAALAATAQRAERSGVTLESQLACPASPALDVARMQRALLLLIQNAIEAMSAGGRLRVESRRDGDQAVIQVCDDGPGIPEAIGGELLEPFVSYAKPGRCGIGLAVARHIVRAHGGSLSLANGPSRGAVAEIRLPLPGAAPGPAAGDGSSGALRERPGAGSDR